VTDLVLTEAPQPNERRWYVVALRWFLPDRFRLRATFFGASVYDVQERCRVFVSTVDDRYDLARRYVAARNEAWRADVRFVWRDACS
jgi:hypothetical protein